jgi:NADPH-dependent curcumin reductase CurA
MTENRQVVLARRPEAAIDDSTFALADGAMPAVAVGAALVRNLWLSIDPAQRAFLHASPTWGKPVAIGGVVPGMAVGEVVASRAPELPVGRLVSGWFGWQDFAVTTPRQLGPLGFVPPGVEPPVALSVLGLTGLTGYFGVVEVGRPRVGQTMVVSAAAGATGSVAGQVARLSGCSVIGIAGGAAKCRWVTDVGRFDAVIDRSTDDVGARLRELLPGGVELYFDNVGGPILDAVLGHLAYDATVIACGAVSSGYVDDGLLPPGPRNYVKLAGKSARMEGFTVGDFADRHGVAVDRLRGWLDDGEIQAVHDVLDGLELAPAALRRVLDGHNVGKQLVRVADRA